VIGVPSSPPDVAFHDLSDLEDTAVRRWDDGLRAYIQDGAGSGRAIEANRAAHGRWALRSRVLVDVSRIDTATTVLGTPIAAPIMVAPSGLHTLVHAGGEVATAQGARDAQTIMILSSGTGRSIEDVASTGASWWFQLYWGPDRDRVRGVVELAERCGCAALCLTADMPVRPLLGPGMRAAVASVAHARPRYILPRDAHLSTGAWDHDPTLTWKDLDWLRSVTELPIVIKGIMTAEDALLAATAGAAGVVVSNHGGRALDTPVGTLDVLPDIARALQQAGTGTELYIDGGFRHGSEVLAALALGARAVLMGRPALWALALDGAAGVTSMFTLLRTQLEASMARVGTVTIAEIDASNIMPSGRAAVTPPITSARRTHRPEITRAT
jgi:4-hydroxymandelate oxidase